MLQILRVYAVFYCILSKLLGIFKNNQLIVLLSQNHAFIYKTQHRRTEGCSNLVQLAVILKCYIKCHQIEQIELTLIEFGSICVKFNATMSDLLENVHFVAFIAN